MTTTTAPTATAATAPAGQIILEALQRSHYSFFALHVMADSLLSRCLGFSATVISDNKNNNNNTNASPSDVCDRAGNGVAATSQKKKPSALLQYERMLRVSVFGLPFAEADVAASAARFLHHPDFEATVAYCVEHHVSSRRHGITTEQAGSFDPDREIRQGVALMRTIFAFLAKEPSTTTSSSSTSTARAAVAATAAAAAAAVSSSQSKTQQVSAREAMGLPREWSDRIVSMARSRVFRCVTLLLVRGLFFRTEIDRSDPLSLNTLAPVLPDGVSASALASGHGTETMTYPLMFPADIERMCKVARSLAPTSTNCNDSNNNTTFLHDNDSTMFLPDGDVSDEARAAGGGASASAAIVASFAHLSGSFFVHHTHGATPTKVLMRCPEGFARFPEAEAHFLRTTQEGLLHDAMNNYATDDATPLARFFFDDAEHVLAAATAADDSPPRGHPSSSTSYFSALAVLHAFLDCFVLGGDVAHDKALWLMTRNGSGSNGSGNNGSGDAPQVLPSVSGVDKHQQRIALLSKLLLHPASAERELIASVRVSSPSSSSASVGVGVGGGGGGGVGLEITWRGQKFVDGVARSVSLRVLVQRCLDHLEVPSAASSASASASSLPASMPSIPSSQTKLPPVFGDVAPEFCGSSSSSSSRNNDHRRYASARELTNMSEHRATALLESCGFPAPRSASLADTLRAATSPAEAAPRRAASAACGGFGAAALREYWLCAPLRLKLSEELALLDAAASSKAGARLLRSTAEFFLVGFPAKIAHKIGGSNNNAADGTSSASSSSGKSASSSSSSSSSSSIPGFWSDSDDTSSDDDGVDADDPRAKERKRAFYEEGDAFSRALYECGLVPQLNAFETLNPRTTVTANGSPSVSEMVRALTAAVASRAFKRKMEREQRRQQQDEDAASSAAPFSPVASLEGSTRAHPDATFEGARDDDDDDGDDAAPATTVGAELLERCLRAVPMDVAASVLDWYEQQSFPAMSANFGSVANFASSVNLDANNNNNKKKSNQHAPDNSMLMMPMPHGAADSSSPTTSSPFASLDKIDDDFQYHASSQAKKKQQQLRQQRLRMLPALSPRSELLFECGAFGPLTALASWALVVKSLITLLASHEQQQRQPQQQQQQQQEASSDEEDRQQQQLRAHALQLADTVLALLPEWGSSAVHLLQYCDAARTARQHALTQLGGACGGRVDAALVPSLGAERISVIAPLLSCACLLSCELPQHGGGLPLPIATTTVSSHHHHHHQSINVLGDGFAADADADENLRHLAEIVARQSAFVDTAWLRVNGRSMSLLKQILVGADSSWPLFCQASTRVRSSLGTRVAFAVLNLLGDGVDPLLRLRIVARHSSNVLIKCQE